MSHFLSKCRWYFLTHNGSSRNCLSARYFICPPFFSQINVNFNILCLSSKSNLHEQRKNSEDGSKKYWFLEIEIYIWQFLNNTQGLFYFHFGICVLIRERSWLGAGRFNPVAFLFVYGVCSEYLYISCYHLLNFFLCSCRLLLEETWKRDRRC